MIFVQIASYRDPELLPTIHHALATAKHPKDLRFGICWQRGPEETAIAHLQGNPQFSIYDVPWQESRGLGWARSKIQNMYQGELYTLQLDSHHRFLPNWDTELIKDCELTGSAKPIITTYAGMYDPAGLSAPSTEPYKMVADRFTSHGTILFRPQRIPNWEQINAPIPARFVSGHFFFTLGKHCEEYAYDPDIYFAGDEISLAIRSYTLGYDLFHPHRLRVWHEYTRKGRVKHWDDHLTQNNLTPWYDIDAISKRRLRHLLREELSETDLGIYSLGTVRTHRDYEKYAGIDFHQRTLHPETIRGTDPPCTFTTAEEWTQIMTTREITFTWDPIEAEKVDFLYLGVENDKGEVIFRKDLRDGIHHGKLSVRFTSLTTPYKVVTWPHINGQWQSKHEQIL